MATTLGSVASSPARVASPMGGFRPSVSSSINSSVKMISIGPEGGKARVDTSFGSPFTRMKPSNPNLNPSGQIFGESGLAKPKTADSVFGPKTSQIGLNKPNPKVGYTPELSKAADISATFTKAKIRNQELATQRKNISVLESLPKPSIQNVKGNERISTPINTQIKPINFRLYQTIPEAKPPDQVMPAGNESRISESKTLTSNPENYKTSPINQVTKPEVNIFAPAQKILSADSPLSTPKSSAGEKPLIEPVQKNIQLGESNLAKPETSLKIDIDPKRFIEPQVLVSKLDLSSNQLQSIKETINSQYHQDVQGRAAVKSYQTEKLSDKQKNSLLVLAPLIKEVDIAGQDRLISSIGLSREDALPLIEDLKNSSKEKIDTNTESKLKTSSSPELIQAVKLIQMTNRIDQSATNSGENESVLIKKAQSLISTIKQTYQLEALGHPESELGPLVEKMMGEEIIPRSLKSELSVLLVQTIRKIRTEELLESPKKLPNQIGLYQVDVEKQDKRAKLAITSINEAPQNENGEISRDYVIAQIQKNNHKGFWGGLAERLGQSFDGSMDEPVFRLKKLRLWENTQKVAKTIDDSMAEFPAVEPVFKQTSKEVGIKEIEKTIDPKLAETTKTLIKTLIVGPNQALVK